MALSRFRRRLLLALPAVFAGMVFVAPAGSAQAAVPVAGISYNGTSVHGRYTVASTTSCVANDTTVSAVCVQPSYLDLTVTPTAKAGAKCSAYGFDMGYVRIKADGAFSDNDDSPNSYDVTVTGQFTTARTLKGSIKNVGCPSDTFDITLPALVSPLSPCEILVKVHAVKVIGGGLPGVIEQNSFSGTSGECMVSVARVSDLELVFSTSRSSLALSLGGMQVKTIAGPGPGATLYSATDGNFFQAVVVFHHGSSWAGLSYDFQRTPCPSSTPAGTSCVTKSAQSAITAHVESSAHKVYALL